MKIHHKKTVNPYFQKAWDNLKPFELRCDDCGYQTGDIFVRQEYDPINLKYGREILCKITYVLRNYPGIQNGFCILGLKELEREERCIN